MRTLLPTGCGLCSHDFDVDSCRILSNRIEYRGRDYRREVPPLVFRFDAMKLGVNHMMGGSSEVLLNRDWRVWESNYESGVRLARALYVLKRASSPEGMAEDEARFEREVRGYREAPNKTVLSEEVRRFKVRADSVA